MPLNDNMRGAFLMMLSMAAFALNDVSIKVAAHDLPLFQAILLRGVGATGLILVVALVRQELRFRIGAGNWRVIAVRTLAEIGGTVFFLLALIHMPLASLYAILQSLPLAITLAGAVFLREKVGWRRYGAILIGFAGVMLIVRPGGDAFDRYAIFAVISVAFIVVRDLVTRRLSREVPSLTVAFVTAAAITVLGAVGSIFTPWQSVGAESAAALGLAAVFLVAGYLVAVMVMRVGEISFTAPFRYTGLVWAIVLGMLVFGEYPDALTLLGSAVVVGMGLYTFYRERQLGRKAARQPLKGTPG